LLVTTDRDATGGLVVTKTDSGPGLNPDATIPSGGRPLLIMMLLIMRKLEDVREADSR
jgi:hypothetical protein